MEPFKIHILGCGSALPTLKHNASSQLIEMRGKCFMVDCGEGAQMQFRRSHIHFSKLNAIFISHMHGDHCFGLMGLLSTLGMLGRTSKLRIYAPKEYATLFRQQVEFFMQTMEYEMEMIPVDTEKQQIIMRTTLLRLRLCLCSIVCLVVDLSSVRSLHCHISVVI